MVSKRQAALTHEILKERLKYDKDTGLFEWKHQHKRGRKEGSVGFEENGYHIIALHINKRTHKYLAHRLAWFYVYGEYPDKDIDHINHDRMDNRISNLRLVSNSENSKNQKLRDSNKSGHSGVYYDKSRDKWCARIMNGGKKIWGGRFTDKQEAFAKAKELYEHYGFHKNHGASE